jgi:2-oxoglutarate ferredoxin oxidoreductase subunit beta
MTDSELKTPLTRKDFASDLAVRWCPGCGDFSILSQVQKTLPELGVPRENIVFISGIGCSSRFPYYMNTYGIHSIHGRAPTLATGLKCARPELTIFVVTGDGDGLSIGGNHFLHALRRNIDINILLFNNRIYGLTKGQYSPTSEIGKKTKSSPDGSIDNPINPIGVAIGAETSFILQRRGLAAPDRSRYQGRPGALPRAREAHDLRQGRGEGHPPERAYTGGRGCGRGRRG